MITPKTYKTVILEMLRRANATKENPLTCHALERMVEHALNPIRLTITPEQPLTPAKLEKSIQAFMPGAKDNAMITLNGKTFTGALNDLDNENAITIRRPSGEVIHRLTATSSGVRQMCCIHIKPK